MLLETDNSVAELPGYWLGPQKMRMPVTWTYPEWGIFGVAFLVVGAVMGVLSGLVIAWLVGPPLGWAWGVLLGAFSFVLFGIIAGWVAVRHAHPHLGSHQNVNWHLRVAVEAFSVWRWSRGPTPAAERRARWALTAVTVTVGPGPWWLRIPAAVAAARYSARYLVARFWSVESFWSHQLDRFDRRADHRVLTFGTPTLEPKGKS